MVYINTHNINFTQYAQYTQYTHCTVCAIYTVYCALFTEAVCNRRSALVCRLPFDFISQADTNWFSGGRDQVKHLLVETSGMQPIKTEPNAKISAVKTVMMMRSQKLKYEIWSRVFWCLVKYFAVSGLQNTTYEVDSTQLRLKCQNTRQNIPSPPSPDKIRLFLDGLFSDNPFPLPFP